MTAARLMLHTYWNKAKKFESMLKAEKPHEQPAPARTRLSKIE